MKTKILFAIFMVFWVFSAVAQNDVGIGTTNPAAKLDVRGNGISYDVFNASNDKALPLDSILSLSSWGNLGIGTFNTGAYKLVSLGGPSAFSPQMEVWNGNPNLPGSRMLGDIVDVGLPLFNGALGLYLNGNKRIDLKALGSSFLNGGNVGIGITVPQEILHLNGAVIVGLHLQPTGSEVAGTIEWNGSNFMGCTGPGSWVSLDVQNQPDNDWMMQPSGWPPALGNPELVPMMPPGSISMAFPGDPNQGGIVWIPDRTLPGAYPHQLMLESTTNATISDASMLFRMSDWSLYPNNPPYLVDDYSMGIYRGDMSFKLYRGSVLAPTLQGDIFSMFRANASGVIDMPNQSRVRATVPVIDSTTWQLIQPGQWTAVNYITPMPGMPLGPGIPVWDEQSEFTAASSANQAVPPVNAYFTAQKEGFYQVNARCEFKTDQYWQGGVWLPVFMRPGAYVAIAVHIDVSGAPVNWTSYAIGNHLQITSNVGMSPAPPEYPDATKPLLNNNAPNVSDVIYLQQGDRVSVWVYQWAYKPMMLRVKDNKLYFSIHKVS